VQKQQQQHVKMSICGKQTIKSQTSCTQRDKYIKIKGEMNVSSLVGIETETSPWIKVSAGSQVELPVEAPPPNSDCSMVMRQQGEAKN